MYKKILSKKEEVEYAAPKCRILTYNAENAILAGSDGEAGESNGYSDYKDY